MTPSPASNSSERSVALRAAPAQGSICHPGLEARAVAQAEYCMPNQPISPATANQPAPFYYLHNFRQATTWLRQRYADLLNDEEQVFLTCFDALPQASQALLVRLIMRKGPHFRSSRLNYPEIGDLDAAAAPLLELGWLDDCHPLGAAELGTLLRRDELIALLAPTPDLRALRKPELVERLQAATEARSFRQWCPGSPERLLTLRVGDLCERLRLMFFGNLSQGWEEFVLAELGIFRYEQVPLTPESRGFSCRLDIELYRHLHHCRTQLEAGQPCLEVLELLGQQEYANPWLRSRHDRLLFALARQLEREGDLQQALALYARSGWSGARQRQIRILEKLQQHEQAWALVQDSLDAPESEAELQLALRVQRRLARKLGQPAHPPAVDGITTRLDLNLPGPHALGVEAAVREHLDSPQAPVHYVENSLITGLFGLLCWDAIFAPLPGAFFHPFQSAPADLHSPDFQHRRRPLFEGCLAQLDSDAWQHSIRRTWHSKQGIQSPFVHWSLLTETLLNQALHCLPPVHLRAWFQRLLQDIRANRAGMPDLIQFWPEQGSYRMIEVKGPGDRLQDNQRRWLEFCHHHDMPVAVCHVQWASP